MPSRNTVLFYLNHERVELGGSAVFQTLSDYLRYTRAMTGTKVVCSEGDCGACTVIAGWLDSAGRLQYRTIDSCIQFLFQLDCCHIITVEGISTADHLHPAQQAMIDHFGSQCGFCTPGFVMALAHMADFDRDLSSQQIRQKLAGNLCRCTGYEAIVTAAKAMLTEKAPQLLSRFGIAAIEREFNELRPIDLEISVDRKSFYKPATLRSALEYRAENPTARIVAGATDLGVLYNKGKWELTQVMVIAHLAEISTLEIEDQRLVIGAAANWSDLLKLSRLRLPELASILEIFAAEQIRNAATIGGNIMNASPIADSLPCLFALEAELVLASPAGQRSVPISAFYRGYKKMDVRSDEMLVKIHLPLPKSKSLFRLFKVSKRRDLDISTMTLGVYLEFTGSVVSLARIAVGGMAPTVLRLTKTEATIVGNQFNEALLKRVEPLALTEVAPISDVRGSAEFRRTLLRNLLRKLYYEFSETIGASA